jgi:hypothetical protein
MATRMQQRRGTALQWTTADPVLNAGEMGWESDTNKFKIGDGINHWEDLDYFLDAVALGGSIDDYIPLTQKDAASGVPSLDASKNLIVAGASIIVEGATDNGNETTLTVTDPTADRTITFPDATGTVITTGNLSDITNIGVFSSTITMEGSTANDFELTLSAGDPTADRTITFPDETGTVQLRVSDVSDTEIGYLNGVTSAIQTQLNALAPKADPTFTGTVSAAALTLSGDLTVNGTTTNINSTNLVVEDKNIVLGDTATPTDTTADGGGITLKGATDKTINWVDATDAWTSSEDFNLATGKAYEIAGTSVLSGTTLGSGVTGSSLTSVGTIATGVWNGTTIAIANGGTGQTTAMTAATALLPSQTSNSGKYLTNDGAGTLSWGTVTGYSAPTLGSTSISSGATVTTIAGLTLTAPTLTGTVTASGDINLSAAGGPGSVIDEFTLLLMGAL